MKSYIFTQDRGIYGKVDREAFRTTEGSAFSIFKAENGWTIGHSPSGLSVDAIIRMGTRRTRKSLLDFVAEMEAAIPDACEASKRIVTSPPHKDDRWALQAMIDWRNGQ